MRKKIYFVKLTISELAKRGKTITVKGTFDIKFPTIHTTVKEILDDKEDISYIARKLYGKGKIEDITKHFLDNHRLETVEVIKQLGETAYEEREEESEWV